LPGETLEQIRIISNLETEKVKLIQIVLLGQPELADKLASPHLRQLEQRISVRFHLMPLSPQETTEYIRHRISVAGGRDTVHLDDRALKFISEHTQGVPRRINVLCDRALLVAYVEATGEVTESIVKKAWRELRTEQKAKQKASPGQPDLSIPGEPRHYPRGLLVLLAILMAGILGVNLWLVFTVKDLTKQTTLTTGPTASPPVVPTSATQAPTDGNLPQPLLGKEGSEEILPFGKEGNEEILPLSKGELEGVVSQETPTSTEVPPTFTPTSTALPATATRTSTLVPPTLTPTLEAPTSTAVPAAAEILPVSQTLSEGFDEDGVMRTIQAEDQPLAALGILLRKWNISDELILLNYRQVREGKSAQSLSDLARTSGFTQVSCDLDEAQVRGIDLPCILMHDDGTMTVLLGIEGDAMLIASPTQGPMKVQAVQALEGWTGSVTYLLPASWQLKEDMKRGVDASMDIFRVQNALAKLGLFEYSANGNYGSKTQQSVRDFQKSRGLKEDGIVGMYTFIALKAATESGVPRLSQTARP